MHFPKILQRKNQVRSRDRKTKREINKNVKKLGIFEAD